MAGKAGSAAMSRAGFAGWQHHHLVGQKTAILEGDLYCRPHQVTLRSGLFVTVSFHRLTDLGICGQIFSNDLGSL